MSPPREVRVVAPAKVNLGLEVLGRRGDGYHEVRTWMLAIGLADRVEARASEFPGIRLEVRGPAASGDVPGGRANLAWRGAEEALRRAAPGAGVDLVLEKAIPSGAGLGGGSSDAAAAWVAVSSALGLGPAPELARGALAALGSDCVFFLDAAATGAALCVGRGEEVRPCPGPERPWWIALATPDLVCPTAQVYAALKRASHGGGPEMPERWASMGASELRPFLFNRLEAAACEAFPRLRAWRTALDPALWRLSGSGSSFFALCDSRGEAERALDGVRSAGLALRGSWIGRPAGHGAKESSIG